MEPSLSWWTLPERIFHFAYQMSFSDYLALGRARERLGPLRGWGRYARCLIVGLLFPGLMWWMDGFDTPLGQFLRWGLVPWMVGIALANFVSEEVHRQLVWRWHFSRHVIAQQKAVVEIDEKDIRWVIGPFTGAAPWASVIATPHTDSHAFLFLSKIEAITLPKRGLQGEDWTGFLDFMAVRTSAGSSSGSSLTESGSL